MALDNDSLKNRIVTYLQSEGFVTQGKHAQAEKMARAIAKAVVDEIQQNALVEVNKGSSAGSYKVT
ncbi:hypothetical protein [Vibrio sp. OPT18]|uniref:hypothetical protein n=1 Tax=Vibrio sp. OPT18 TaxID=2778641 RepID=UPI00187EB582|nr:hypothetical protein [Vibrio sp. OPT18]MBE8578673.1 hypothetical protein [Vibrio sp. OPT18]